MALSLQLLCPSLPPVNIPVYLLPPPSGWPPQGSLLDILERSPGPTAVHELGVRSPTAGLHSGWAGVDTTMSSLALTVDAVGVNIPQLRQTGHWGRFALTLLFKKSNISANISFLVEDLAAPGGIILFMAPLCCIIAEFKVGELGDAWYRWMIAVGFAPCSTIWLYDCYALHR